MERELVLHQIAICAPALGAPSAVLGPLSLWPRVLVPYSRQVSELMREIGRPQKIMGEQPLSPSALITRVSHECSPVRCACSRAIKIPVVRCDELHAVRLAPDAAPFRCGAANRLGRRSALSSTVASVAAAATTAAAAAAATAAAAAAAAASLTFALASLLRNFSSTHLHHHTATCLDKGQGINHRG